MGLSRMFQIYRDLAGGKEQIRSFNEREEALAWLLEKRTSVTAKIHTQ